MNDVEIVESSESSSEAESSFTVYTDNLTVYYNGSSEAAETEEEKEESTEESTEESSAEFLEDLERSTPTPLLELTSADRSGDRSVNYSDIKELWTVTLNNVEYKVLFPRNSELDIIDGVLVNRGSSNVTGAVIDSSFSDSQYIKDTITVVPLYSNSSQTQVYRYGSRSYITHYSPGQNNNLVTTVSYYPVEVVSRPVGFSFTKEGITIIALLLGLLIVQFIGGLIRR